VNHIEDITLMLRRKDRVSQLTWKDYLFAWAFIQETAPDHILEGINEDAKSHQKLEHILELAAMMRPLDQDRSTWS